MRCSTSATCCTQRSHPAGPSRSRRCLAPTAGTALPTRTSTGWRPARGFRRDLLAPRLEQWAGEPFYFAGGEPHRAQALWAFAHGAVSLELDQRFADASGLDHTWTAAAVAFRR